jgi:hypothetical protein
MAGTSIKNNEKGAEAKLGKPKQQHRQIIETI